MPNFYPSDMGPSRMGGGDSPPMAEGDHGVDRSEAPKAPEEETNTALVPDSAFPGGKPKPGDTITATVVRCFEDECEVSFKNQPQKPGAQPSQKGMEEMPADEELDLMAKE